MIQNPKAGVVAHKGILLGRISLAGVGNDIDIEVAFVPLLNFITGQILAPLGNAVDRQLGQWLAAKPAVMYNVRNHKLNI